MLFLDVCFFPCRPLSRLDEEWWLPWRSDVRWDECREEVLSEDFLEECSEERREEWWDSDPWFLLSL